MVYDEDDEVNWTPVKPLPAIAALGALLALDVVVIGLLKWLF